MMGRRDVVSNMERRSKPFTRLGFLHEAEREGNASDGDGDVEKGLVAIGEMPPAAVAGGGGETAMASIDNRSGRSMLGRARPEAIGRLRRRRRCARGRRYCSLDRSMRACVGRGRQAVMTVGG